MTDFLVSFQHRRFLISRQHRRGCMAHCQDDDPLYQKYRLAGRIGAGTYGVVYEATCAKTGFAKAIKSVDPSARKSGRESVEIQVLQKCDHPNVIKLEEVIDAFEGRPSVALVFPAYDMDLAKLFQLRRGCPDDLPPQDRYRIAQDLWKGLQYMHSIELLHRDIKPSNILVTLGSQVRVVLADMGLASAAPMHVKPNIVVGDQRASCMLGTANVCTSCYAAPELLCAHHSGVDNQYYGFGVDVWSGAAVTFEVATLERYCRRASSPVAQFSDLISRMGKPPDSFVRFLPSSFRKVVQHSTSFVAQDLRLTEPWLSMVPMGIQWNPKDRASAQDIAICLSQGLRLAACTSSAALPGAKSPAAEGELASAMPSTHSNIIRASPRDSSIPVLENSDPCSCLPLVLGPTEPSIVEVSLPRGSTCDCRGNCGQPKHSRHKCDRPAVVLGSQLCLQCSCSWLGCTSPRKWGKHCKFHKRKLDGLSSPWQVAIAAGDLNCELVPADTLQFCDFMHNIGFLSEN